jgi:hypothetical protein
MSDDETIARIRGRDSVGYDEQHFTAAIKDVRVLLAALDAAERRAVEAEERAKEAEQGLRTTDVMWRACVKESKMFQARAEAAEERAEDAERLCAALRDERQPVIDNFGERAARYAAEARADAAESTVYAAKAWEAEREAWLGGKLPTAQRYNSATDALIAALRALPYATRALAALPPAPTSEPVPSVEELDRIYDEAIRDGTITEAEIADAFDRFLQRPGVVEALAKWQRPCLLCGKDVRGPGAITRPATREWWCTPKCAWEWASGTGETPAPTSEPREEEA